MSAITNIFRRGAVYHYRRRVRWPDGARSSICMSLRTRRLSVARQRAARLADRCETLRRELAMQQTAVTLTDPQRREIFARQLAMERDSLEALHCAVLRMPNDDVLPQRHSEELPLHLEAMERVCEEWIRCGCPKPSEFGDLEEYVEAVFRPELDELERIYLLGGLGSLEFLWDRVNAGVASALRGIGAFPTESNRVAATTRPSRISITNFFTGRLVLPSLGSGS